MRGPNVNPSIDNSKEELYIMSQWAMKEDFGRGQELFKHLKKKQSERSQKRNHDMKIVRPYAEQSIRERMDTLESTLNEVLRKI